MDCMKGQDTAGPLISFFLHQFSLIVLAFTQLLAIISPKVSALSLFTIDITDEILRFALF